MTRIFDFKTIRNFRDFGDYENQDGRKVKARKLFRTGHLADLNTDELAAIKALEISLIMDLRHMPERQRQPNKWTAGDDVTIIEYPDKEGDPSEKIAPHEAFMQNDLKTPEDARHYMRGSYRQRPHDPGFVSNFSQTLKYMAATGEPILIHCAAGKDRTGTLAAVILSSLGVDADTIMKDYMLTMEAVDIDAFLEPASKFMSQKFERTISAEALRPLFGVEPGFLEQSLEAIGDMDSYIETTLKITPEERRALAKHYLV
ncbi:MAG: tyrosine-protein phosphatase [Maricaulaceae bacterium]